MRARNRSRWPSQRATSSKDIVNALDGEDEAFLEYLKKGEKGKFPNCERVPKVARSQDGKCCCPRIYPVRDVLLRYGRLRSVSRRGANAQPR